MGSAHPSMEAGQGDWPSRASESSNVELFVRFHLLPGPVGPGSRHACVSSYWGCHRAVYHCQPLCIELETKTRSQVHMHKAFPALTQLRSTWKKLLLGYARIMGCKLQVIFHSMHSERRSKGVSACITWLSSSLAYWLAESDISGLPALSCIVGRCLLHACRALLLSRE